MGNGHRPSPYIFYIVKRGNIMEWLGKIIEGRWNGNSYKIEKLIGQGGIGRVYQVIDIRNNQVYALKISGDLHSITRESDMLSKLKHVDCLPRIMDIDDYKCGKEVYYFIVQEFINGDNLKEYISKRRVDIKRTLGIVIIIGAFVKELHKSGYVLGDLKPENIMVDIDNNIIKIVDLGGITKIGNSIGEFTPLYDRARWNMGLRRADEGYDLFSICMLGVFAIIKDEKRMIRMSIFELIRELRVKNINKEIIKLFHTGLTQEDIDFDRFYERLKKLYKKADCFTKIEKNRKLNSIINTYFFGCVILFFTILFIIIAI